MRRVNSVVVLFGGGGGNSGCWTVSADTARLRGVGRGGGLCRGYSSSSYSAAMSETQAGPGRAPSRMIDMVAASPQAIKQI
jgi:hypothetical protein